MFKNFIRKIIKKILKDEYFISTDIGINETEVMVIKYSYKLGRIEVISDNKMRKTPLMGIENEIKNLVRKYNASLCMDYPIDMKSYFKSFNRDF